jgi:hypothetical protein
LVGNETPLAATPQKANVKESPGQDLKAKIAEQEDELAKKTLQQEQLKMVIEQME